MEARGMTATIKDVAKVLGISAQAVRMIFRGLERQRVVRIFVKKSWRRTVYELLDEPS